MENLMNKVRLFIIKNKVKKFKDDQRQFFFLESIKKRLGDNYRDDDPFDEEIFENVDDMFNEHLIDEEKMTVEDLMKKLENYNKDKVVIITSLDGKELVTINQITETESNVKIIMNEKIS